MFWLAFARAIHIAASILLAAVFGFRLIVLLPVAANCGRIDRFQPRFKGVWARLALASWIIVVLSGLAWFWLVAASISGAANLLEVTPDTLQIMLFQTHFGHLWLIRGGCCLVMGALLLTGAPELLMAALSLVILVSLGPAGHAGAIVSRVGPLAVMGDMGHLAAAALWPGGLLPLLFILYREHRTAGGNNPQFVAEVVRRFSALSLAVVALLAATGILNAYFIVGSFPALFDTSYGQLLLIKIAFFFLMLCLGAWNLLVLKPRLCRAAMGANGAEASAAQSIGSLVRSVACETLLAAAVILVIGFLDVTPPPVP